MDVQRTGCPDVTAGAAGGAAVDLAAINGNRGICIGDIDGAAILGGAAADDLAAVDIYLAVEGCKDGAAACPSAGQVIAGSIQSTRIDLDSHIVDRCDDAAFHIECSGCQHLTSAGCAAVGNSQAVKAGSCPAVEQTQAQSRLQRVAVEVDVQLRCAGRNDDLVGNRHITHQFKVAAVCEEIGIQSFVGGYFGPGQLTAHVVANALCLAATFTGTGFHQRLTLSCAADRAGLGGFVGCVYPAVSQGFALNGATDRAGLGSCAGCVCPVMLAALLLDGEAAILNNDFCAFHYGCEEADIAFIQLHTAAGCEDTVSIHRYDHIGALVHGQFAVHNNICAILQVQVVAFACTQLGIAGEVQRGAGAQLYAANDLTAGKGDVCVGAVDVIAEVGAAAIDRTSGHIHLAGNDDISCAICCAAVDLAAVDIQRTVDADIAAGITGAAAVDLAAIDGDFCRCGIDVHRAAVYGGAATDDLTAIQIELTVASHKDSAAACPGAGQVVSRGVHSAAIDLNYRIVCHSDAAAFHIEGAVGHQLAVAGLAAVGDSQAAQVGSCPTVNETDAVKGLQRIAIEVDVQLGCAGRYDDLLGYGHIAHQLEAAAICEEAGIQGFVAGHFDPGQIVAGMVADANALTAAFTAVNVRCLKDNGEAAILHYDLGAFHFAFEEGLIGIIQFYAVASHKYAANSCAYLNVRSFAHIQRAIDGGLGLAAQLQVVGFAAVDLNVAREVDLGGAFCLDTAGDLAAAEVHGAAIAGHIVAIGCVTAGYLTAGHVECANQQQVTAGAVCTAAEDLAAVEVHRAKYTDVTAGIIGVTAANHTAVHGHLRGGAVDIHSATVLQGTLTAEDLAAVHIELAVAEHEYSSTASPVAGHGVLGSIQNTAVELKYHIVGSSHTAAFRIGSTKHLDPTVTGSAAVGNGQRLQTGCQPGIDHTGAVADGNGMTIEVDAQLLCVGRDHDGLGQSYIAGQLKVTAVYKESGIHSGVAGDFCPLQVGANMVANAHSLTAAFAHLNAGGSQRHCQTALVLNNCAGDVGVEILGVLYIGVGGKHAAGSNADAGTVFHLANIDSNTITAVLVEGDVGIAFLRTVNERSAGQVDGRGILIPCCGIDGLHMTCDLAAAHGESAVDDEHILPAGGLHQLTAGILGLAAVDLAAVHIHLAVELNIAAGVCDTAVDLAVVQIEDTGFGIVMRHNAHRAAIACQLPGAIFRTVGGTADNRAAIHIECTGGIHGCAVLAYIIDIVALIDFRIDQVVFTAVQRAAIEVAGAVLIAHPDNAAFVGAFADRLQYTGLFFATVENAQCNIVLKQRIHTAVSCAGNGLAVQIQTDLGVIFQDGLLISQRYIAGEEIVTALDGQGLAVGPLHPLNFLVAVVAVCVYHLNDLTLIHEDQVYLAVLVCKSADPVHLQQLGLGAGLAAVAGHIVNCAVFSQSKLRIDTLKGGAGVKLDFLLANALDKEVPGCLGNGHIINVDNTDDRSCFVKFQTHSTGIVDGRHDGAVSDLQFGDLAIDKEPNVPEAVLIPLTGRQAGFGLNQVLLSVHIPVDIAGLDLVLRLLFPTVLVQEDHNTGCDQCQTCDYGNHAKP